MTIQIVKLMTGETVLGKISASAEGRVQIAEPVTIRLFPSQIAGGQPTLGFAPWPDFADDKTDTFFVEPLHIAYSYVPNDELIGEYTKMVSQVKSTTGIITG